MASKFQNRMAGTIILVAIGVIILPGLLDGKKKHYKEEFAAIPLVPKPGDQQEPDLVPPVTQPLSGTPASKPVSSVPGITTAAQGSAASADEQSESESSGAAAAGNSANTASAHSASSSAAQTAEAQEKQQQQADAARARQQQLAQQRQAERQARAEQQASDAAAAKAKAQQQREERERQRALQALNGNASTPASQPTADRQDTPAGAAWVIQLGALRNAARVSEIVSQLRAAGFRAYSLPSQPVQGQINRILVGPDSSKSALQGQVAELKSKTGLSGVVRPYSAR
ncbi:cell division protein DedD [Tatumella saanichensis]|uniref:cell division protein DedD n=1 Tax=Tatumella saanichensis TaxID=480813 RepID=UPI0004A3A095|nr:cell division protein DedD [Tatumella saanichensis]